MTGSYTPTKDTILYAIWGKKETQLYFNNQPVYKIVYNNIEITDDIMFNGNKISL
jgi:hypothetical protein